jgi:hypothetical protein
LSLWRPRNEWSRQVVSTCALCAPSANDVASRRASLSRLEPAAPEPAFADIPVIELAEAIRQVASTGSTTGI